MSRTAVTIAVIACLSVASLANAAIHHYGKKPLRSPLYPGALGELVNDPARVEGEASLGKSEFQYQGDAAAINKLIARYAALDTPHAYLTVGHGDASLTLQIQHYGDGRHYLTIHVDTLDQLHALKLPKDLVVEALPPVLESLDSKQKAAEDEVWRGIQKLVKRRAER